MKLQPFDSKYFRGKRHFEDNGTRNYLLFQSACKYYKMVANGNKLTVWISKGLSEESIKPPAASNNNLAPALNHINDKLKVKFD